MSVESEVRRRPLHAEEKEEDAQLSGEKTDGGTDYWDLDDEGWEPKRDPNAPETAAERQVES